MPGLVYMDTNKKINILLFFILSAFAIGFLYFIGSVGFISPILGDINLIDEGQFGAWIAHMLHGKLLYKDIYAAYGPLYIYPLYLLSKIFGQSAYLIRVVYIVVNTYLSLIIVWLVLKK